MSLSIDVPQNRNIGLLEQIFRFNPPPRERFQQKISLEFSRGHYVVKTVQTTEELQCVLQLRYQIFRREFQGCWLPFGTDFESLDMLADHLVIIDKRTCAVVGAYRLVSSQMNSTYYSAGEFEINKLIQTPGNKLELSRACIDRKYRNGVVLSLLWRGLAEYIRQIDAAYIFGCASIKTMDPVIVSRIQNHFSRIGVTLADFGIAPLEKYHCRKKPISFPRKFNDQLIPPLFQSYLKAGAKVALTPAWDYEFRCVDFLTLLRTDNMKEEYRRRYS